MKLVIIPMLQCTGTEYKTEIEPIIKTLDDLDLCPQRNEKRNTTWNCDTFEDCLCCPFWSSQCEGARSTRNYQKN